MAGFVLVDVTTVIVGGGDPDVLDGVKVTTEVVRTTEDDGENDDEEGITENEELEIGKDDEENVDESVEGKKGLLLVVVVSNELLVGNGPGKEFQ